MKTKNIASCLLKISIVSSLFISVATAQKKDEVKMLNLSAPPTDSTSTKKTSTQSTTTSTGVSTSSESTLAYVKKEIKISKYYTRQELSKIAKLHLRDIYRNRLSYIIEVFPFLSLNQDPGSTLFEMGIPETEANINHLQKEIKNKQAFLSSLFVTLNDVLPYSDKENMISTILFFDEIIKKSNTILEAPKGK